MPVTIVHRQIFWREQSAKRFAANVSVLKTNTFFVAETDDRQRERKANPGGPNAVGGLDSQNHSEYAVESPGVTYAVAWWLGFVARPLL